MTASISFASVCLRKLERLKLVLTTQRSAIESDVYSDETHVEFLESVHYRLHSANTQRGKSLRSTMLSTKRLAHLMNRQLGTSPPQSIHLPPSNSQELKAKIRTRKMQNLSIGGFSTNTNYWDKQGSFPTENTGSNSRPSLISQLRGQLSTKNKGPIGSKEEFPHEKQASKKTITGFTPTGKSASKVLSNKSLVNQIKEEPKPQFFSSVKKLGLSSNKKPLPTLDEGNITDRYPGTFYLDIIKESPIRRASRLSNPSSHSIYMPETVQEGKIPKSPPSQITHFDVKAKESPQKSKISRLSKLVSSKKEDSESKPRSSRSYLISLAGLVNKP